MALNILKRNNLTILGLKG